MSMKKKFLALALAGMVAMPVVANATTIQPNKTVSGSLTQQPTSDLIVSGTVDRKDGSAAAGRIQVELPTAMSFSVDKLGQFQGPTNFEINNSGSEPVKVEILNFSEGLPNSGIEIVQKSSLEGQERTNGRQKVSLALDYKGTVVDLYNSKNGQTQVLCNRIEPKTVETINILGNAGTSTAASAAGIEDNGASEDFTVKFQISYAQ